MAFFPDDSVQPPPLWGRKPQGLLYDGVQLQAQPGADMPPMPPAAKPGAKKGPPPPGDPGMMNWLRNLPPMVGGPTGGPPSVPQVIEGPYTRVQDVQAPAPKTGTPPPPPAAVPGAGVGRVKELDDLLMKRVADTAPVPAPQSPLERRVLDPNDARNFAPVRMIMGSRAGHADDAGNFVYGAAPQKMKPEDVAFARAMEAHQVDAAQKMAQRQALTGAMEVAPKMLPGEAEASKVAFMQSPEGALQMATMGMINAGMPPEQVALAAPQLKNLPGFAPKVVPGQQQGPPPSLDPIAALSAVNPHFLASVYDPKTRQKTPDAQTIDEFMNKAFAVENGKFVEQNFPALQEYANTMYGKDSIKDRVTSSPMMQAAERKFPMFAGLRMTPPHALGLMAQGIDPLSPEGQAMALRQQQVPLMERIWGGLGVGEKEREQNAAWRAALNRYLQSSPSGSTGTTPPLPPRR